MWLSVVQTSVEGLPYHKNCFKCVHGGCTISPSNYAALEGRLYCKHHYSQLFKEKGNYSQFNKTPALKPTGSNVTAELWYPPTSSGSSLGGRCVNLNHDQFQLGFLQSCFARWEVCLHMLHSGLQKRFYSWGCKNGLLCFHSCCLENTMSWKFRVYHLLKVSLSFADLFMNGKGAGGWCIDLFVYIPIYVYPCPVKQ
jgi:hypothetical protein